MGLNLQWGSLSLHGSGKTTRWTTETEYCDTVDSAQQAHNVLMKYLEHCISSKPSLLLFFNPSSCNDRDFHDTREMERAPQHGIQQILEINGEPKQTKSITSWISYENIQSIMVNQNAFQQIQLTHHSPHK